MATSTNLRDGRPSLYSARFGSPSSLEADVKSLGVELSSMSITLPNSYRPTEREPFMNAMQQEYFRQKLLKWKSELVEESNQTLQNMQEESLVQPDLPHRAPAGTDGSLEFGTRGRFRRLVARIHPALK